MDQGRLQASADGSHLFDFGGKTDAAAPTDAGDTYGVQARARSSLHLTEVTVRGRPAT
ncbi:hypothetical protein [Fodinicola acaciae]|uniref:hypothetical protein n=1 Tax=Fodinicola acaciae TaxID=2681555 RepID=UPI0013D75DAC|nr:hypothetical protein [Fodinicola acaciae]